MGAVPAPSPLSRPEVLMLAMPAAPPPHTPPAGVAVRLLVNPAQATGDVESTGRALTVITAVRGQLPPTVYDMVVVPAPTELTTPELLTVAIAALPPDHTPP